MITSRPCAFVLPDGLRRYAKHSRKPRSIPGQLDRKSDGVLRVHALQFRTDSSSLASTDLSEHPAHDEGMDRKADFSQRLNSALDEIGYPEKGEGRQVRLGKDMGVSQRGARKWLEGEVIPAMENAIALATLCRVHTEWLLSGRGARYIDPPPVSKDPEIEDWARRMECMPKGERSKVFRVIEVLTTNDVREIAA